MQRRYIVDLFLSAEKMQSYYAGHVTQVSATDRRGVRLQFPLQSLRPFVGHSGVRGTFVLTVDRSNRLVSIKQADIA